MTQLEIHERACWTCRCGCLYKHLFNATPAGATSFLHPLLFIFLPSTPSMVVPLKKFTIDVYISLLCYTFSIHSTRSVSIPQMVRPSSIIPSPFVDSIGPLKMTSLRPPSRLALRARPRLPMAEAGARRTIIRHLFQQLQKGSLIPFRKRAPSPYPPPLSLAPSIPAPTSLTPNPKLSNYLVERRDAQCPPWARPQGSVSSSQRLSPTNSSSSPSEGNLTK
ncbi:uncharacterized protein N7496_011233 [Penicillium cataractarum]|uniref:Uncharacterized protein n=1 Tax=Penicillium cataractarum TaxID=2100454 RepID=A0A9W9REL4_9EURO|nr:uncharacterized protein N7496_011233 [Penicillium cataractarum]KAJ5358820.1 hypothetical protein N7496_011233 [Penicillium cataractarum]